MVARPVIIIDSREQLPYPFAGAVIKALATADYSCEGYVDRIAIERKSLGDMFACIGQSRERFERELARLAQIEFRGLVIEATLEDALSSPFTKLHPSSILGSLA